VLVAQEVPEAEAEALREVMVFIFEGGVQGANLDDLGP